MLTNKNNDIIIVFLYNNFMTFKDKTRNMVSDKTFFNLEKYVSLIEEKNKVMNLTGFKGDKIWEEGIFESIYLLENGIGNVNGKRILDIGAGAGFPSIPYLIANPNNSLTIYESQKKRVNFLLHVKETLELKINVFNIRGENSSQIETFDFVTARAVAPFKILAEISHRPAKIGAKFIFIKGPMVSEEIDDATIIVKKLEIKTTIKKYIINGKENMIVTYRKNNKTPDLYPRKWIDIIKK